MTSYHLYNFHPFHNTRVHLSPAGFIDHAKWQLLEDFPLFCLHQPRHNLAMIAKIYVPLQTHGPREGGGGQKAVIFRDRNQIKWRLVWSGLDEWQEGRWRCVTQRTLAPGKEINT